MNRHAAAYLVGVTLLFGGFGAIGAAAGLRVAISLSVRALDCGIGGADCMALLAVLDDTARTFLVGGGVAMVCGGIGVWGVRHAVTDAPDQPTEEPAP